MNRNQFILVLLAVAIIGGAGLVLLNRQRRSWSVREAKMGDKALPHFQFNDVCSIRVKGGGSDFNVARENGLWRMRERSDYPANFQQIKDLLLKLKELKIVQSDRLGPSQLDRVGLDEPGKGPNRGTLLEFKDAQGKVLDSLLVGKRHLRPQTASDPFSLHGLFDGCYILLPADPGNVLLVSDDLASVAAEPGSWLSKDFFKAENIKSISLVSSNGAESWTLSRATDSSTWTLADSKPDEALNTTMASEIADAVGFLSFVDVISKHDLSPTSSDLERPLQVNITTFDHFDYTLKIGAKRQETYHLHVAVAADIPAQRPAGNDEKPDEKEKFDHEFQAQNQKLRDKLAREQPLASWVYVIEPGIIEQIVRERSQLLAKKTVISEGSAVPDKAPLSVSQ